MKTTKIISTMCAVLITLAMSACGETSQSNTDSKAEAETTTTTTIDAETESETTTSTTALSDEPKEEVTTTKKEEQKSEPKSGFDEATNIEIKNGGLIYHFPNYYKELKLENNNVKRCECNDKNGSKIVCTMGYFSPDQYFELNETFASSYFDAVKEQLNLAEDFKKLKINQDPILNRTEYESGYIRGDTAKGIYDYVYIFLLDNPDKKYINYKITIYSFKSNDLEYDYMSDADKVFYSIEEDKEYVYEKPTNNKEDETSKSDESKNTYEHNSYYDVVETASLTYAFGGTSIIHKVKAKQDVSISATMLAYSESGSVIGKGSSDIVLTKGQTNYFSYYFEEDVSNAQFKASFKTKDNSYMLGERNGVELVEYSITEDNLYLTLKQTIDELGAFAKYKILLYNGNQIIGTEDGYFSVSAENLDGKGSTDVAEVWTYGETYDRIEFIYEP